MSEPIKIRLCQMCRDSLENKGTIMYGNKTLTKDQVVVEKVNQAGCDCNYTTRRAIAKSQLVTELNDPNRIMEIRFTRNELSYIEEAVSAIIENFKMVIESDACNDEKQDYENDLIPYEIIHEKLKQSLAIGVKL